MLDFGVWPELVLVHDRAILLHPGLVQAYPGLFGRMLATLPNFQTITPTKLPLPHLLSFMRGGPSILGEVELGDGSIIQGSSSPRPSSRVND